MNRAMTQDSRSTVQPRTAWQPQDQGASLAFDVQQTTAMTGPLLQDRPPDVDQPEPDLPDLTPEQRLLYKVLIQALKDSLGRIRCEGHRDRHPTRTQVAARVWLRGTGRQTPLSARLCCEGLGIDYTRLRRRFERHWEGVDNGVE
jgi:hypothetical protein